MYFKTFRKLWNTGNYHSKRELYNAVIQEIYHGIEPEDDAEKWLINRECDATIQSNGKNNTTWLWNRTNLPYKSRTKKK